MVLPRRVAVRVEPATASVTITDTSGVLHSGSGGYEGLATGPLEVAAEAPGFESETLTVDARTFRASIALDKDGQLLDKVVEFAVGPAPKQVAFRPGNDELWVTLLAGTGFEVYEPMTGELIAAIDLPEAGSVEVIFNTDGSLAYVSQMETATVYEIDAATKTILRSLRTGGVWTKVMALSPDEQTLWASNWVSNDVSEIDLETGEVLRRLPTVATPRGLFVTPSGDRLYVAGFDQGEIQVFDLETGRGEVIYRSGGAMRHFAGSADGTVIYASDMARAHALVIDTATNDVTELAKVGRVPNTIDLTPDGRVLFVSNRGRNNPESYYLPGPEWGSVSVIDAATGNHLDAVIGGNQTTGLDVSPDGTLLAFSDFLDDTVSVYRIPDYAVLAAGNGGRFEQHLAELGK